MITISNIAKSKLIDLIKSGGQGNGSSKSLFLYLKGGGCNGFSYNFKIINGLEKPNKLDEKYDLDGYNLFLCNKSLLFIIGTHIDYIQDIMGSRFDFKNNNIESKCGCGTSFNFKD